MLYEGLNKIELCKIIYEKNKKLLMTMANFESLISQSKSSADGIICDRFKTCNNVDNEDLLLIHKKARRKMFEYLSEVYGMVINSFLDKLYEIRKSLTGLDIKYSLALDPDKYNSIDDNIIQDDLKKVILAEQMFSILMKAYEAM